MTGSDLHLITDTKTPETAAPISRLDKSWWKIWTYPPRIWPSYVQAALKKAQSPPTISRDTLTQAFRKGTGVSKNSASVSNRFIDVLSDNYLESSNKSAFDVAVDGLLVSGYEWANLDCNLNWSVNAYSILYNIYRTNLNPADIDSKLGLESTIKSTEESITDTGAKHDIKLH